jgi:glycosyltransferase involved in cell wall biosynthesis
MHFGGIRRAVRQADIVHAHSYWNVFSAVVVHEALAAGRPVVLSPRGMLHRDAIGYSSPRLKQVFSVAIGHRQLGRITAYHFQSEDEAANSVTGLRSRPAATIVVDNGVEIPDSPISARDAREQTLGQTPGDVHLLFFGRLNRIKGIDLQVAALSRLRASGVDAKLHLVGPDDGALEGLRAAAERLGVTPHLCIHGPVFGQEKHLWLRGADAVLMSSEFENNSNAALEIMAAGGVLVGTNRSVGVAAGEFGAALRVGATADTLAAGIRQVIEQPRLSAALRSRAVAFVRERHDWPSRAARMYDFYESLL